MRDEIGYIIVIQVPGSAHKYVYVPLSFLDEFHVCEIFDWQNLPTLIVFIVTAYTLKFSSRFSKS